MNATGRNEGLSLLWKGDLKVDIINFSQWHISAWVEGDNSTHKWILTGFHSELDTSKRALSWNLLKISKTVSRVISDFNEIIFHHEKWGGKDKNEK